MKLVFYVLAALFILIAALQFNDPDPVYWIAVYSGVALTLFSKGLGKSSDFWSAVVIGAILAGMTWTAAGFWDYVSSGEVAAIFGDMRGPGYVEESREFLGLSIALALLLFFRRT